MTCQAGPTKSSWVDRAGTVQPRLAGGEGQGREFFLARCGQFHTFGAVSVFTFERGEELKNAVLSLIYYIPWVKQNRNEQLKTRHRRL